MFLYTIHWIPWNETGEGRHSTIANASPWPPMFGLCARVPPTIDQCRSNEKCFGAFFITTVYISIINIITVCDWSCILFDAGIAVYTHRWDDRQSSTHLMRNMSRMCVCVCFFKQWNRKRAIYVSTRKHSTMTKSLTTPNYTQSTEHKLLLSIKYI